MVRFRVLGTLEADEGGRVLDLGSARRRVLLALLLVHANEPVSSDRLIDGLWPERPPATAAKIVQGYVSQLRQAIGPDAIETRGSGYLLHAGETDALEFERLVARARTEAGEAAAATIGEALGLWRGRPFADVQDEPWAQTEIARLEELRILALEERCEIDLALGESSRLVPELEALVADHPLRERLRALLMTALYRSGRQTEALRVFADYRARLVEELGIEPGRELHQLQRRILAHDPDLEPPAPSPRRTDPARNAFLGREHELEELRGALDDARHGRGRVVLIAGEAGIGKTRLADEAAEEARARGMHVLAGRCWEAGRAPPYWPWAQALRGYVREADPETLRAELGAGVSALRQILPEVDDADPESSEPPRIDTAEARFRFFDAVTSFLQRAAGDHALLLVLDDLHTADTPSLLLLQFVVRESAASRLVVLGTYRDDASPSAEFAEALAELARSPQSTTVGLGGLGRADVGRYIELVTARAPAPDVVEAVHAGTEGNPLFVVEVVRLLAAKSRLETAGPRLGVPKTLRDLIAQRLAPVSPECRRVLELASVVGREFELAVLARAAGLGQTDVLDVLDEATTLQLVADVPETRTRLRFGHALFRDVLYDGLSPTRRRQHHRAVGEALEELSGRTDVNLAELAHHFCEAVPAVDAARAVAYAQRAADQAVTLLAPEEAHRLYETALSLVDDDHRVRLLLGIARSMWMRGERPEPQALAARDAAAAGGDREAASEAELLLADIHWYEGSRALAAEDLERATELAAALPAQTAATANVFEHAARFAMLAGEYDEAIRLGRSGLELARGLGLESIAAHCLSSLGVARACSGDGNGLADIRAALEIAARTNDGWAVWRARVNLADCLLWQTGAAEQAFAERHRLRPLLEAAGSWAIARWNESYDAWESYWLGRWPDALRLCDEFIEHVERGSPHNSASELYSLRAHIRVARGEEGALDDARTAIALARRAQDARSLYPALASAAEVAAALEQDAESDALVDELLAAGGPEPYPAYVTPLARAALLRGRPRDALARLAALGSSPWRDAATAMLGGDHADAADRFAAIGVLPEEAYARLLAAESLAAAGQGAEAQLQVGRCTAFFERVGATRYLDRCARLSVVAAS